MKPFTHCMKLLIEFLLICFCSPVFAATAAEVSYTFTTINIPIPNASQTAAKGINNAGDIVGYYRIGNRLSHGYFLRNSEFFHVEVPHSASTIADAINSTGNQIVGSYSDGTSRLFSFLFDIKGSTAITIDPPGSTSSQAAGVNADGLVIGKYLSAARYFGFIYNNGKYTTLNYPGSTSTEADGINDAGQIVGSYIGFNGHRHGFMFQHNGYSKIDVAGCTDTSPTGINNHGDITGVVGCPSPNPPVQSFILTSSGNVTLIAPVGGHAVRASGINDKGEIVGTETDHSGTSEQGFLATPNRGNNSSNGDRSAVMKSPFGRR